MQDRQAMMLGAGASWRPAAIADWGPSRRAVLLTPLLVPLVGRASARASPRRVVVAGGGIAEIVCAVGARDRIVGADSTSLFPRGLRDLARIGYLRNLSAEGVLSLAPDLLLLAAEAGPPSVLDQLRRAGVRIAQAPRIHDPASLIAAVRFVAEALALRSEGEVVARAVANDFDALARITSSLPRRTPVVFVLAIGGGAPQAAGRETAADAMITLAAGRNVVDAYRGYRPISAEYLLGAAPDALVTTNHTLDALGGATGLASVPALSVLPAVRSGNIVSLDSLYLLGFGPRTAHAARDLADALHPGGRIPPLPPRSWLADDPL